MKHYEIPTASLTLLSERDVICTSGLVLGGKNGEGNAADMSGIDFSDW